MTLLLAPTGATDKKTLDNTEWIASSFATCSDDTGIDADMGRSAVLRFYAARAVHAVVRRRDTKAMNNIGHINGTESVRPIAAAKVGGTKAAPVTPKSAVEGDRVEISDLGRLLSQAKALPDIRAEKVSAVRDAIKQGGYLTNDKIDQTLDAVLEDLATLDEVGV